MTTHPDPYLMFDDRVDGWRKPWWLYAFDRGMAEMEAAKQQKKAEEVAA